MKYAPFFFALFCLANSATASPWLQDVGRSYAQIDLGTGQLDGFPVHRSEAYFEMGLTPLMTVVAKRDHARFSDASEFDHSDYRFGVRRALGHGPQFKVAAEASVVRQTRFDPSKRCRGTGGELAMSVGRAFGGARSGYTTIDYRVGVVGRCRWQKLSFESVQRLRDNIGWKTRAWVEHDYTETLSAKFESGIIISGDRFAISLSHREEFSGRFSEAATFVGVSARY